ncbi:O-antigen ligase [Anabaena sp. PCC 7108]|uniref:O-antigen ligase family protein n=1 Tax=Anabaena sp. PCC 7108 TaxID=163908 RepID=UPI00034900C8|nr:O-antigen ligase family protein [Anabaena sp. PCC 7108]
MTNKFLQQLFRYFETVSVVLLLLFAETLNIPSVVDKSINAVSYLIVTILVISQFKRIVYVLTRDISLLLLVMIAVLSNLWSEAIDVTSIQSRSLLRTTFFAAYLASRYSPRELISLLSSTISISIITSFAASIAIPSFGTGVVNGKLTWKGIYAFKQYLARFMAIGSLVFLMKILDKKYNTWLAFLGLVSSLILILQSQSKTALILFIFSLLVLPIFTILKQSAGIRLISLLIFATIFSSIVTIISLNLEFILVDLLGKDMELNGRIPVWTLVIEKALERRWFGYGYAAFWYSDEAYYIVKNSWASLSVGNEVSRFHSHNGFVDLFTQLGFVGLGLFIINLINLFNRLIKIIIITKTLESFWMLQVLLIKIILNTVELITILSPSNIFWILYVYIALSSAVWYRRLCNNQPAM